MSPIVGQIIAELVLDGRSSLPIAPFAVEHFNTPSSSLKGPDSMTTKMTLTAHIRRFQSTRRLSRIVITMARSTWPA